MTPPPGKALWDLDPAVAHLNHGSFGAAPRPVLEAQAEWRRRIESNPMRFFAREGAAALDAARNRLAAFVGASPEQLAFVQNASTGLNAVLRSLDFAPGDQLLVTDHGYGAATNAVDYVARRSGAGVAVARIAMPIRDEGHIVESIVAAAGPKTRLAVIDHITSSTAVVFPIAAIVAALHERGLRVLVDGAHAPGMVDLDLQAIGADYYTGNCHKWMCAPKGSGFLWVREPDAAGVVPLAVGWGRTSVPPGRSQFHADFDWVGTMDPSPYLCVPAAIDTLGGVFPGGWEELRASNHDLVVAARGLLGRTVEAVDPVPVGMVGSMAAVPLPPASPESEAGQVDELQVTLARQGIEVAVTSGPQPGDRWLRISAQAYNSLDEYERLAAAL